MHRDLLRRLAKRSLWPRFYFASVRCWDSRRQLEVIAEIPVLLPHEMLNCIAGHSDLDTLACKGRLTDGARRHLDKAAASLGEGAAIVPLGLWLDGTPCNWDRTGARRMRFWIAELPCRGSRTNASPKPHPLSSEDSIG